MTIFAKVKKKIKSDVSFFSEARPYLVALLSSLVVVLALAMSFVLAFICCRKTPLALMSAFEGTRVPTTNEYACLSLNFLKKHNSHHLR